MIKEKLEIAHQLARLNVDIIEAGFPLSSNEDFEAVRRIAHEVEGPMVCGLARALTKDIERAGEALKDAPNHVSTRSLAPEIHMQGQMRKGRADVLLAVRAVELAKSFCDSVRIFSDGCGAHRPGLSPRRD